MKQLAILIILFIFTLGASAQKKSEIVQRGIEVKRSYEQSLEDGEKEHQLIKEEFFDIKGDLIELKEYDNGDIDAWFKYKFDVEGNLIEEIELNSKGEQKEKTTYKFENGVRVERLTYDGKNRLTKSRIYKYDYR